MSTGNEESPTHAAWIRTAMLAGIPLVLLLGAGGCDQEPSSIAGVDSPPVRTAKGGGKGGGGGTPLQIDLIDPTAAGAAGVYSDGGGTYPDADVDDVGALRPLCGDPGRIVELRNVTGDPRIGPLLGPQSRCNDDGPQGGWVFLKAPGLLDLTSDCFGGPDCGFDTYPSYTWKGPNIKPTGWMSGAARYFEEDTDTGQQITWVFQDPSVDVEPDPEEGLGPPTSWRFTATKAHLYGLDQLCSGGDDANRNGIPGDAIPGDVVDAPCLTFDLEVDFTVTPDGS